jgi:sugar/nucleoside kinase (ribokinase family)
MTKKIISNNLANTMPILIVGSVAFDTITTPFGHAENMLGGAATYFSLAASHFTTPEVVAVVGEDFSEENLKVLTNKKIDVAGLQKTAGKTFRWGGTYSFDLNNRETLFTELNVFENFKPQIPEEYKKNEYVFLGNIHPLLQQQVLSQITKPKLVGLDTMNYWIESAPTELEKVLEMVDVLIINDAEARQLTGEHNLFKASKNIFGKMGSTEKVLVIKRGEYGLLLFQNNNFFNLPAYPLEDVFDPTGAGDSFAGGFMGYLAKTEDVSWENLKRACVYGSCMASFCVEKMGTERLQSVTENEIKKRLSAFKELTNFQL